MTSAWRLRPPHAAASTRCYDPTSAASGRVPHHVPRAPRGPVHSSSWRAPWWTSIPRPSTVRRPARAAAASRACAERVVHEVGHDLTPAAAAPRVHRQRAVLAHADRRGLHDQVGAARRRRRPARPRSPGQRGRRLAPCWRCGSPRRPPGSRRRPAPGTTARAAPPAPSTTAPSRPGRSRGRGAACRRSPRRRCSRPRAGRRAAPRRCWPHPAPRPWRCARRPAAATSALWGIVTDSPARPRAAHRVAARRRRRRRAPRRRRSASPDRSAAKAALCSAGDRRWRDG